MQVDFSNQDLSGKDFSGLELRGADFHGAILQGAIFADADLAEAVFTEADLRDADLTNVKGLTAHQLMRTNLAGAHLPEAIAAFESLDHVEQSAGIARPLFVLNLILCAYSLAVVSSTSDAALLTNAPSSLLPDIDTPLPTTWFYYALPAAILAIYIYFHAHLEQIVQDITRLPSIFPDGIPITRKIYPWFLLRLLAREISGQEKVITGGFSLLRSIVNVFMIGFAWWLTPLTLLLIWLKFLPSHDWGGALWIIAMMVVSFSTGGFGVRSVRLRGEHPGFFDETLEGWRDRAQRDVFLRSGEALVVGAIMVAITGAIFAGGKLDNTRYAWLTRSAEVVVETLGFRAYADFAGQQVSKSECSAPGTGPNLRGRDLRKLNAAGATMACADLTGANLEGAILEDADLTYAILDGANLKGVRARGALFNRAETRHANFSGADLTEAKFLAATIAESIFAYADLQAVDMTCATANDSDFTHADLRSVTAVAAEFNRSRFDDAEELNGDFSHSNFTDAAVVRTTIHEGIFDRSIFEYTKLTDTTITASSFQLVNMLRADFSGARFALPENPPSFQVDFSWADLEFSIGLTQEMLEGACGDMKTTLPDDTTIQRCNGSRPTFSKPVCDNIGR